MNLHDQNPIFGGLDNFLENKKKKRRKTKGKRLVRRLKPK
jgi:hypothetical protein